jgi:hypothetical protein
MDYVEMIEDKIIFILVTSYGASFLSLLGIMLWISKTETREN